MSIGMIGAGAIGSALAARFAAAGEQVVVSNSRGPQSLARLTATLGTNVMAATVHEAATQEKVVVAVPWRRLDAALIAAGVADWDGRIVIDTTNPLGPPDFRVADLGGRASSEVVAGKLPGARLVKAFNTLPPHVLVADPHTPGGRRVIFLSGNDGAANREVSGLIERAGWAPVDLGRLSDGGRLQQFPGGPLPTLQLIRAA